MRSTSWSPVWAGWSDNLISEAFEQLISRREGETLEFKQEMPSSSDLAKLVTAFYNTRGGVIVFGVEDETRRLIGVSSPQGVEEGIINILRGRCSLDVMSTIEFFSYRGKDFVAVTMSPRSAQALPGEWGETALCASRVEQPKSPR
jgi:ATP-dependent DNA helicase RecG